MTVPIISHDEAEAVGILLATLVTVARPAQDDTLAWADAVQFVLLRAREIVAARGTVVALVPDSDVSRAPTTRTIAEISAELRS